MGKKYCIVSVRLSEERHKRLEDLLKALNKNWTWACDFGLNNIEEKSEDFLRERLLQLQKDVIQCNTKLLENQNFVVQCSTEIEQLRKVYTSKEHRRSIVNPSKEDVSWLQARLRHLDDPMTPQQFLSYCQVKAKDGVLEVFP